MCTSDATWMVEVELSLDSELLLPGIQLPVEAVLSDDLNMAVSVESTDNLLTDLRLKHATPNSGRLQFLT